MPPRIAKQISEDILIFTKHKEEIKVAAEDAKRLIANEVISASKVMAVSAADAASAIGSAAEIALRVTNVRNSDDHDLLIVLKTGNEFIRSDIANLTNGVTAKIEVLQNGKADKIEFDALAKEIHEPREKRMRDLENRTANYMLTMGLLMAAFGIVVGVILLHIFK